LGELYLISGSSPQCHLRFLSVAGAKIDNMTRRRTAAGCDWAAPTPTVGQRTHLVISLALAGLNVRKAVTDDSGT